MTGVTRLQEGRQNMADRCMAVVAITNTPPHVIVQYRQSLTGRTDDRRKMLSAPRPVTRKSLYVYLHECAHFHLNHGIRRTPSHVKEFEAEQWAHQKMREAGIAVPRVMTRRAREYVARKIRQARKCGAQKIDKRAAAFADVSRGQQKSR